MNFSSGMECCHMNNRPRLRVSTCELGIVEGVLGIVYAERDDGVMS